MSTKIFLCRENSQSCALCGPKDAKSLFFRFTEFQKWIRFLKYHIPIELWIMHLLVDFIIVYKDLSFYEKLTIFCTARIERQKCIFFRFSVFFKSAGSFQLHYSVERWTLHLLIYFFYCARRFLFLQKIHNFVHCADTKAQNLVFLVLQLLPILWVVSCCIFL